MSKIHLNRNQIKRLIDVYTHFRDIEKFSISLEDNQIYIGFDLCDTPTQKVLKSSTKFVPTTFSEPDKN